MANQEKTAAEKYRDERKARIAKAAKQRDKKKKSIKVNKTATKVIAIVLAIAIVAWVGKFAVEQSGIIEKSTVIMSVGDVEVTQPEYAFYYTSLFSNYFNYSYQYDYYYGTGYGAYYIGFDWATSPDVQEYTGTIDGFDEDETPMWTDFFDYSTKQNIQLVKASIAYAEENGIELTDEDYATIEETMTSIEESAESSNYSTAAYLRTYYGTGVTEELAETIVTEQILTERVSTVVSEEFAAAYSEDEIQDEYDADPTVYGVIDLRAYTIYAETETITETDADTGEETETTSLVDGAMDAALEIAEQLVEDATSEAKFKTAVSLIEQDLENEDYELYISDDSYTLYEDYTYDDASYLEYYEEEFSAWVGDTATEAGDTFIAETEDSYYTVYYMVDPIHTASDSYTYDVRHILISFIDSESDGEDQGYSDIDIESYADGATIDLDVTMDTAQEQETLYEAQEILVAYLSGDQTAESFGELALEYTDDSNGEDGGLYEDVTEGEMVTEFESWALTEGREEGDVGIVESDYGYHIMYYVDSQASTWQDTIAASLATVELTTFSEDLVAADSVVIDGFNDSARESVEDMVISLAKAQISSINSSAS
ncbi:MAG: peptidylprolyl isomerase [Clostridia bacterium]